MEKPAYGSLSLQQLRAELKKRNAKVSGRKHELVERLASLQRLICRRAFYL
jgi:hypothetical protein